MGLHFVRAEVETKKKYECLVKNFELVYFVYINLCLIEHKLQISTNEHNDQFLLTDSNKTCYSNSDDNKAANNFKT